MKICFIDAGIYIEKPELISELKQYGEIDIYQGIPDSMEELVSRGSDAEVIAFALMQFTNEMIDNLPKLKILQFIGTGVSNFVDVKYAESKGIKVLNIDGYGSNAVAEFAVAVAFSAAKKVVVGNNIIKSENWSIDGLLGKEISGSTVGIVGTGSIGRLVAEKYLSLGTKVIANDIYENEYLKDTCGVEYVSLEKIFKESDIISLHMKVTESNEKIINKFYFDMMKKDAILINVARAELVNNEDLYLALSNHDIGGAAIDVYESEPPSKNDYKLGKLDNVIATPHIAYYTQEASDNSIKMTTASIVKHISNLG